jgi:hypothetical protein
VPLSQQQKSCLQNAIETYRFPSDYFDFVRNTRERLENAEAVEVRIWRGLTSPDAEGLKNGLANVLYWGYAQMGIRDPRVQRFRSKVNACELIRACDLLQRSTPPSVVEIKNLGLPEFSGLSFVSKIRMFLDPSKSAVLDNQIMKIHRSCPTTLLANLHIGKSTQIPITKHNSEVYKAWCRTMVDISDRSFDARFRAVDIERGCFQLIQDGSTRAAAQILSEAPSLI